MRVLVFQCIAVVGGWWCSPRKAKIMLMNGCRQRGAAASNMIIVHEVHFERLKICAFICYYVFGRFPFWPHTHNINDANFGHSNRKQPEISRRIPYVELRMLVAHWTLNAFWGATHPRIKVNGLHIPCMNGNNLYDGNWNNFAARWDAHPIFIGYTSNLLAGGANDQSSCDVFDTLNKHWRYYKMLRSGCRF